MLQGKYTAAHNKQVSLTDIKVDAATVTETIVALAEFESKRGWSGHSCTMVVVLVFAALAGFSQQIVHVVGTVRRAADFRN
jgi:phage-related holin